MPIARAGMHHQPGPLVDDQDRSVFERDRELDRLRPECTVGLERLRLDLQQLDSGQPVPSSEHTFVPADRTELDPALKTRARELRQPLRKEPVEPLATDTGRGQLNACGRGSALGLRQISLAGRQGRAGYCGGCSSIAALGYNGPMIRHAVTAACLVATRLFAIRLLAAGLVLALAACGTLDQPDETVGWPPDKLYSEARKDLDSRNWTSAIKLLEKLEARYPFGRWAEQAQLQIAYAHYRNNERVLSVAAIDRFIKLHPNHPTLDYAYYMKGVVNFNEQEGLFAALGGQDLAERDLQAARDAFDAFRTLITRFPQSRYVPDAEARMLYLVDSMAAGELAVARYYFRRGAYVAAANRAQGVIRQFPNARSSEEALTILADSYDKLGMPDLRDDTRRVLKQSFPESSSSKLPAQARWWEFWR